MPADAAESDALGSLRAELERLRALEDRLRAENEHLLENQRAFEEHRERYSDLFDLAPMAWLTLDAHGAIQTLNLAAMNLLGLGRRQLAGAPLLTLLAPEDRHRLYGHLRACDSGKLTTCELRLRAAEGSGIPIRLSTRRTLGPGTGYTVILFDLSERDAARAERQRLVVAEREARIANQAKDQFIAMLSHELRTPLTPVLAAASELAVLESLPESVRETLAIVHRNVKTEAQLIDDLLDVARIAHGKLGVDRQPVDAHQAVRDALETLNVEFEAKRHPPILDLAAQHHWVDGDATRLQQVFWNLLRNAAKFTLVTGQIHVRSWNIEERLVVEVADDGQGMTRDTLARLFLPFEQANQDRASNVRGLGLGLPICRGILDQHQATVTAISEGRGKGSRFVVEIASVDRPAALPAAPASEPRPPTGKAVRILLVEDHEDTADIFERLLRRRGYEVQVATSLQSALSVQREEFDVLLSDVGLSDGSGLDLMRALRKTGKVKGIALSGYGTEEDIRASKEAGFAAHLTKPVNFGTLLEAIATLHR